MQLMTPTRLILLLCLALPAAAPAGAGAQIAGLTLVERGEHVPLELTAEQLTLGRTVTHGLLATARRDVTRPVSDAELTALGNRGTLLRVRLAKPERVLLVGLGARARATRVAAYVPPGREDRAYVFLGRSRWNRIVVVELPEAVRAAVRRLRASSAAGS
jgi:hypothetical protein